MSPTEQKPKGTFEVPTHDNKGFAILPAGGVIGEAPLAHAQTEQVSTSPEVRKPTSRLARFGRNIIDRLMNRQGVIGEADATSEPKPIQPTISQQVETGHALGSQEAVDRAADPDKTVVVPREEISKLDTGGNVTKQVENGGVIGQNPSGPEQHKQ